MKSNPLYLAAAAGLLALWWYNRQGANIGDALPINLPPAQQTVIQALTPTVDSNGNLQGNWWDQIIIPYGG